MLFREQNLSDPDLMRASRIFGNLQEGGHRRYLKPGEHPPEMGPAPTDPAISVISNLGPDGKPIEEPQ